MHVIIINRQQIIRGRPELYSMSKSSLGLTDGLTLYRYGRWLITRVTRENFLNSQVIHAQESNTKITLANTSTERVSINNVIDMHPY